MPRVVVHSGKTVLTPYAILYSLVYAPLEGEHNAGAA